MKTQQTVNLNFDLTDVEEVRMYLEYLEMHTDAQYHIHVHSPDRRKVIIQASFPEEDIS
ncbi:hypothetical protein ABES05_16100 [Bacillus anthracis]|uniref:hypothetical protein n=1 Tax=Bacillus anthracis TaxID=1392 RepID=UPI003D214E15